MKDSPYHPGELEVQQKTGETYMAQQVGRGIKELIPTPALKFIDKQPMVFVSSADPKGNIWLSVLVGKDGFLRAKSEQELIIDLTFLESERTDIFWRNIKEQPQVGMLFIEPATRRRLRVNGTTSLAGEKLTISVQQAYANCPKYIQTREVEINQTNQTIAGSQVLGTVLNHSLKELISKADTFFVGSGDASGYLDASHRGGNPGFVQILDEKTLKIPDYPGNTMYNTLGNFAANPKAGLLFVDFEEGKTLQLIGKAKILYQETGTIEQTGGTQRFWEFSIQHWILSDQLKSIKWTLLDYSRYNP